MAAPEGLTLDRHRDFVGRARGPIVREVLLGILCAVLLLGLLNAFGQVETVDGAEGSAARFEVSAPTKLRGGLFFEARFGSKRSRDHECDDRPRPGLARGHHAEHLAPAPIGESSRDGTSRSSSGASPPATRYILYLHFQVNPTAVGIRSQDVGLYDGERLIASFDRDAIVWP